MSGEDLSLMPSLGEEMNALLGSRVSEKPRRAFLWVGLYHIRLAKTKSEEAAKFDSQIQEFSKQAQAIREEALKRAGVAGMNPYPGQNEAQMMDTQQSLKYHATADWDYRTKAEREGELPAKTKKWLMNVRGY